jgi:hypothetical protein
MVKTYSVLLDIKESVTNPAFTINTNDLKTVKLSILINQDKEPLDLTGATVRLAVKKPDKTTVLQDCTIVTPTEGICEIILDTQAYVIKGDYDAEVMVYFGTDTVAVTSDFRYTAKKGILSDDTIESTNEWQSITKAIADTEAILEDLRLHGTGVDAQARADIATQATLLAQKATKKNGVDWINVVEAGIANDGVTDVTSALQTLLNNAAEASTFYFPSGTYLISSQITLGQEVTLIGDSGSVRELPTLPNYSKIKLADGVSNVIMIKSGNYVRCTIKNLILYSSSYTQTLNSNKPLAGSPASIYNVNTVNAGVNGIYLNQMGSLLENVSVVGCSGYGVFSYSFNYIRGCYAFNCGTGFEIGTDNSVVQCRSNQCGTGLKVSGIASTITNFRVDGASLYGVHLNGAYRCVVSDITLDQINYCGLYMQDAQFNSISGDFSRCGQYYGGSEISTVPDANKYQASAVAVYGTCLDNRININVTIGELLDDGLATSKGPATKLVNYGFLINSHVTFTGRGFDGTTENNFSASSVAEMNRFIYIVSGSIQKTTINISAYTLRYFNTSDHKFADINGVRLLNTAAPKFVPPDYIGQRIIYNGVLFVGYGTSTGNWMMASFLQSSSSPAYSNNATIQTYGVSLTRVSPPSAITGTILETGTYGGQEVTVLNESASANTVTFAVSGSNVSGGSTVVINGGQASKFIWNSITSLWCKVS